MKMQELLTIDPQFKNLIPPLQRTEYLQLEENLLADGCRDPLVVWRGTLIDGHNRYEICTRHSIPFSVKEMNFYCREEAIAWICANQLGRRNLSEETRKYLQTKTDLSLISSTARSALVRELHILIDKTGEMLRILEEE